MDATQFSHRLLYDSQLEYFYILDQHETLPVKSLV